MHKISSDTATEYTLSASDAYVKRKKETSTFCWGLAEWLLAGQAEHEIMALHVTLFSVNLELIRH
jgi:hypothetical protein